MVEYSFTSLKFDYESGWVPRLVAAVWLICCMMSGICFASGLRDPTEPPFMADTLAPKMQSGLPRLQSILRSPDYQGAMLDGQMVQVDGFDGNWKLLSIGTGFVVVSRDGQRRKLYLYTHAIELHNKKNSLMGEKAMREK